MNVFDWKYLLSSQSNYTSKSRLNGFSEGVIKMNKERNLTLVCIHCFNSSIFLSPFSFPECGWHRNPSKAFYQAFQSGSRLRDSKAHSDRYSTKLQECNNMCVVSNSSKLCFFFHVHGLSLKTKLCNKHRIGQYASQQHLCL